MRLIYQMMDFFLFLGKKEIFFISTSGTFPASLSSFFEKKIYQQNKKDEKTFLKIQKNYIKL